AAQPFARVVQREWPVVPRNGVHRARTREAAVITVWVARWHRAGVRGRYVLHPLQPEDGIRPRLAAQARVVAADGAVAAVEQRVRRAVRQVTRRDAVAEDFYRLVDPGTRRGRGGIEHLDLD